MIVGTTTAPFFFLAPYQFSAQLRILPTCYVVSPSLAKVPRRRSLHHLQQYLLQFSAWSSVLISSAEVYASLTNEKILQMPGAGVTCWSFLLWLFYLLGSKQ